MTNEELAYAVAKIVALDAKRTREEWLAFEWRKMPHGVDPGEGGFIDNGQLFFDGSQNTHEDIATVYTDADLHFIAAAPLMAQVIRQLWEEREANRTPAPSVTKEELADVIVRAFNDCTQIATEVDLETDVAPHTAQEILTQLNVSKKE